MITASSHALRYAAEPRFAIHVLVNVEPAPATMILLQFAFPDEFLPSHDMMVSPEIVINHTDGKPACAINCFINAIFWHIPYIGNITPAESSYKLQVNMSTVSIAIHCDPTRHPYSTHIM
jgi:hypothetical protein